MSFLHMAPGWPLGNGLSLNGELVVGEWGWMYSEESKKKNVFKIV